MTNPDNIVHVRFNVKEECERHWKEGAADGFRFGYWCGKRERLHPGDFAMRCFVVYIVACVLIYIVSVVATVTLDSYRSDVAPEIVRVHDMREAYWR